MTTHLDIDSDLLHRAFELSGEQTKSAAVTKALQEFIACRAPRSVAELFGEFECDDTYDCKAKRSCRK